MTIMGAKTAERLGLMRLIDRRFAGVAKGVGTGKILGRVHTVSNRWLLLHGAGCSAAMALHSGTLAVPHESLQT